MSVIVTPTIGSGGGSVGREEWWLTDLTGDEIRDLGSAKDRRSRDKDRVGLDEARYLRKTHTHIYQDV